MPGKKKRYNARFPPARIKKIMQTDEEVGKVAAPVPVIISRALELFAETLLGRANDVTVKRGARTLTPSHLKLCIETERRFDFLRELVSTVPDLQDDDLDLECELLPLQPSRSKPRGRGQAINSHINLGDRGVTLVDRSAREGPLTDSVTLLRASAPPSRGPPPLVPVGPPPLIVRGVGRRRGRPPKINGGSGVSSFRPRPVEKRRYVDLVDSGEEDEDTTRPIGNGGNSVQLSRVAAIGSSAFSGHQIFADSSARIHPSIASALFRQGPLTPSSSECAATLALSKAASLARSASMDGPSSIRTGSRQLTPHSSAAVCLAAASHSLSPALNSTQSMYSFQSPVTPGTSQQAPPLGENGESRVEFGRGAQLIRAASTPSFHLNTFNAEDQNPASAAGYSSSVRTTDPGAKAGGGVIFSLSAPGVEFPKLSSGFSSPPVSGLPPIDSGSHNFIRSLNSACVKGGVQRAAGGTTTKPTIFPRKETLDEDYDC